MSQTVKNDQSSHFGRFFRWLFRRQTQGRVLIGLAVFVTLAAFFYLEEDWRGWHAWQNCKRELAAKGEVLNWSAYIPPPVPDDQNFFKAPKMQEWFVGRGGSDLSKRLQSKNADLTSSVGAATNLIGNAEAATTYLAWSDQFEPDFDLIRQALKRPFARMDGDYSQPYHVPIPNFVTVRALEQMLAQRTHCYLLVGEPQKALGELTLINDSRRLLKGAPTGKPMTLVAAMINVAVAGLYVNTAAEGFRLHTWQDSQLISLQEQLRQVNLIPSVSESFREMPVHDCQFVEQLKAANKLDKRRLGSLLGIPNSWEKGWNDPIFLLLNVAPGGWLDQNLIEDIENHQRILDAMDSSNLFIFPRKIDAAMRKNERILKSHSPYGILARIGIPNYSKALQTLAHNQTLANEARIACALERYRLANGVYPDSLDALVPQFMERVPHDIIGGGPMHYRRTGEGKFLLYSVGWNARDDGGLDGGKDYGKGDWVWKN